MKNKNRKLAFIAIYVALAIVLDYIKAFIPFLNLPSGGSINIALIPIVLSGYHLGYKNGFLVSAIWLILSAMLGLNAYFINIFQYMLDYLIGNLCLGMSAIFYKKKTVLEIIIGIVMMSFIKLITVVFSGMYFWTGEGAKLNLEGFLFSFSYNGPAIIVTCIMLCILIPILYKTVKRYLI